MSRYDTLREIGRGGMGVVYLAEDRELLRRVALKVLHPALSSDEAFVERFRQEAQLVSGIIHPHVVHINNIATIEHRLAIDMEYVAGESLYRYITREFVTPAVALRITREILLGLAACHREGLVHCDIKPSNVLLSEQGSVKLADFGLARAYTDCLETPGGPHTTSGVLYGTPAYTPPELWDGEKPTPASDLYSVGVVLYEMLSGEVPHYGPTPLAVIRSILTEPLKPLSARIPHLSPEASALVQQLLETDAGSRPGSAEDVLDEITKLPEYNQDTSDAPTVGIARTSAALRRKPAARLFRLYVGVATLLLVLVVGVLLVQIAGNSSGWVRRQADLLAGGLPSAEELLSSWKDTNPELCRVYDVSALDERYPGFMQWLVRLNGESSIQNILGYSRTGLLNMERVSDSQGSIALEGAWSDFQNVAGTRFREGLVSAKGQRLPGEDGITFLLHFTDATDNSHWTSTITARPSRPAVTDTRFYYALQSSDAALSVLYNELLPRRRDWAIDLAPRLSCMLDSSLRAPIMAEAQAIEVDGVLEEALWRTRYLGGDGARLGELSARPIGHGAELLLRADLTAVYVGIEVPSLEKGSCTLTLAVVPRLEIPAEHSATYAVSIEENGRVSESLLREGVRERGWVNDWRVGARRDGDKWSVEIAIPTTTQERDSIVRFNTSVTQAGANGGQAIHQWGFPDTEDALHGILVSFEKPFETVAAH